MAKLTLNDFFCGCGGMGMGFRNAGFTIVGAWDIDKHAVASYKANVGEHVRQADIREMRWRDIPEAIVWSFGFPCQDLSVAGKQGGMVLECVGCGHVHRVLPNEVMGNECSQCGCREHRSASRSGLFFEIMRLLDETQENNPSYVPQILVAENVKGLKPFLGVLESEFKRRGYRTYTELYNSKFWGVPQNRERYYIVGVKDADGEGFKMPEEHRDLTKIPRLSSILEQDVEEKYFIRDTKAQTVLRQAFQKIRNLGRVHAVLTPDRVEKRQNGRRAKEEDEEMFTLTAQDLHGVMVAEPKLNGEPQNYPKIDVIGLLDIPSYDHSRRVYNPEGLCPTLTGVSGGTHHIKVYDCTNYRVRKLTSIEYGRLQAFPMDAWKQVVSDSQAYKQFGNAVTVTVASAVAGEIAKYLGVRKCGR